jgi:hypothetical protein
MFHSLWRIVRNSVLVFGALISIIFVLEVLRALVFVYRLNEFVGIAVSSLVGLLGLVIVPRLAWLWRRHPRVLVPPSTPPVEEASHTELRAYCRYLMAYLGRLADNPNVSEESRQRAIECIENIADVLRHHPLNEDLRLVIGKTQNDIILPILNRLGEMAERQVRDSVRDVMIGVMLSPYPSLDLLIVLYRNFSMVLRIMSLYQARPSAREQWKIVTDIASVVATVNFINLNRRLIENLGSQIPIVGRFVDVLAQGVGAGIFTSITGHAAIARCSAFNAWDRGRAAKQLGAQSMQFLRDVRLLLTKDLMPELKPRIRVEVPPERVEQPGFWDALEDGIREAVDITARSCDVFLIRPAVAGVQGVATVTTTVARGVVHGGQRVLKASARGGSHAFRSMKRAVGTFAERIKYTIIGRRLHG